jgi:hypothetical protein
MNLQQCYNCSFGSWRVQKIQLLIQTCVYSLTCDNLIEHHGTQGVQFKTIAMFHSNGSYNVLNISWGILAMWEDFLHSFLYKILTTWISFEKSVSLTSNLLAVNVEGNQISKILRLLLMTNLIRKHGPEFYYILYKGQKPIRCVLM